MAHTGYKRDTDIAANFNVISYPRAQSHNTANTLVPPYMGQFNIVDVRSICCQRCARLRMKICS